MSTLGGNSKVLIVDDEKNICESLAAIFTSRGYESKVALSAEQAVEMIAEWQPDLAILDVGLPKMNGIDLAIALKNGHPSCRPSEMLGMAARLLSTISPEAAKTPEELD